MKIKYSADGNWYYLPVLVCGFCNWVSVERYETEEEVKALLVQGLDFGIMYDKTYYRICKPFNLWKVKTGEEKELAMDHELIRDYVPCDTCKRVKGGK